MQQIADAENAVQDAALDFAEVFLAPDFLAVLALVVAILPLLKCYI